MTRLEPPEVDGLLKEALTDDLPAHVERRLERRLSSFLESRRRPKGAFLPSPAAFRRLALALISILMVVGGVLLHVVGGRSVFADSLLRLNASVSLSRAVGARTSMACWAGEEAVGELRSPAALAERIYRDWVLLRQELSPQGDVLVLVFRSGDGRAVYEVRANRASLLPEVIRRRAAFGYTASCVWD
jgi:hypothetical protein